MLGIIRVLTTDDVNVLEEHNSQMKAFLNIDGKTECISSQWNGIHDKQSEKLATPKIVDLAEEMVNTNQFSALTVSCAADPALDVLREKQSIPIIGAGSSGAHIAKAFGKKVGVMGITKDVPDAIKSILGQGFVYKYNDNIRKTTDLFNENAAQELHKTAIQLVNENVDVILFACTGFSTIRLKNYLKQHINKPIVDLIEAQALVFTSLN